MAKYFFSLKSKITLSVSLLLVGILTLTYWGLGRFFEDRIKQTIAAQQFSMVSEIADDIDNHIEQAQQRIVEAAAQLPPQAIVDVGLAQRYLDQSLGQGIRHIFDNGMFLFSARGRLIAESPFMDGRRGRDYSHRKYFQRTLDQAGPVISEPYVSSKPHGQPALNFTAPVRDAQGNILGVLAGSVDLSKDNFLGELPNIRIGQTGYLYVVNSSRALIMHPQINRVLTSAVPPSASEHFELEAGGFEGMRETLDSEGVAMLSSFKPLQTTDWTLVANFPLKEAHAPIREAQRYVVFGFGLAILVSLLLVWVLMKHLVAPLTLLTRQVDQFTDRDAPLNALSIDSRDEVGTLAEAFNRMLAEIGFREQKLQDQVQFLQVVIDSIPNPVFYKDVSGRYLGCNLAFEMFMGRRREEIVGRTFSDLFPGELAGIYSEADQDLLNQAPGESYQHFEGSLPQADGRKRDLVFYKASFPDAGGQVGGVIGSFVDITSRKEIERDLKAQKELSENLLQYLGSPCFVLDAEHRVLFWNRACEEITGVKAAEVVGTQDPWKGFYDQQRPCLADLVLDGNRDALEQFFPDRSYTVLPGGGIQGEGWFTNLGGKDRYLVFGATLLSNSQGQPDAAIEHIQDITERKLKEETMGFLSQELALVSGEDFFKALASYLEMTLMADYVLIGELDATQNQSVTTVIARGPDKVIDNFTYALADTPCGNVLGQVQSCFYPSGVVKEFPKDQMLVDMQAEGYAGTPLVNSAGQVIGIMAVVSRSPLVNPGLIGDLMQILAVRAASELERMRARQELEQSLSVLEATLESTADGILVVELGGKIVAHNRNFLELWNIPGESLVGMADGEELPKALEQLQDRDGFVRRLEELHAHPELECRDLIYFKDGRVIERDTKPQRIEDRIVGRVMSFRDITQRKRNERELVQSRDFYLTIFEDFPALIWRCNPEGRCDYFNKSWQEFTGRSPNREMGDRWLEGVHAEDLGPFLEQFRWALQARDTFETEFRLRRYDNEYRWVQVVARPFQDLQGEFAGLIGACFDVTERRDTMDQLRTLSQAVEQSPVTVVVTDTAGHIEYVNPKFTELSGYRAEEVVGANPRLLKSGQTPAEEYRKMWETISSGQQWRGEFLNQKKNGELYLESALIAPVKDSEGEITHYLAIKEDITETRASQQSEQRSRGLSEALAGAMLKFMQHSSINDLARILVEGSVSLSGADSGFLYDLDNNGDARLLASVGHGAESFGGERLVQEARGHLQEQVYYLLEDGGDFLFAPLHQAEPLLVNDPAHDPAFARSPLAARLEISSFLGVPLQLGNQTVGVLGLINRPGGFSPWHRNELQNFAPSVALALQNARAELARHLAEDYLRQAQKMEAVGQLAGGIAHDFNNLITVVNGYSTMLVRALGDHKVLQQQAETILHAGERAAGLTRQLLAFSRRQVLEQQVLNINDLVVGLKKILRGMLRENIDLDMQLTEGLHRVKVDPGQLEQILVNLVVNARDAISGAGKITLATANADLDQDFVRTHEGASAGPHVRLEVRDTGQGMTEEVRARIFEPFYTTKEQGRGTGLGLATVYGIVKQSGGYIWVESAAGRGTVFEVYLPQTVEQMQTSKLALPKPQGGIGGRIMVVEDEADVLGLVKAALEEYGFSVLAAQCPEQALELFPEKQGGVDLLLTDMVMPSMSGPQLAGALRKKQPDLRVLYMSGYGQFHEQGALSPFEQRFLLQKPFTHDNLIGKVLNLLEPARVNPKG